MNRNIKVTDLECCCNSLFPPNRHVFEKPSQNLAAIVVLLDWNGYV
jgi:hypothetical protein